MLNTLPPKEQKKPVTEFLPATWEVDVFSGANEGLIVAEIELPNEDTSFDQQDWIGRELPRTTVMPIPTWPNRG